MPVEHVCPLCGYARESQHNTVLDPICPSCGGVLTAAGPPPGPAPARPMARVTGSPWFERAITALVVTPLLVAAAKLGWGAAGTTGAVCALLLAGLASYVAFAPTARRG